MDCQEIILILVALIHLSVATFYGEYILNGGYLTRCAPEHVVTACILKCNEYALEISWDDQTKQCCCFQSVSISKANTCGVTTATYQVKKAIISLLSENKPSSSSSEYFGIPSSKAFDGGLNQDLTVKTCMHTNFDTPAWVKVDLLRLAVITHVKIYNRNDNNCPSNEVCADRLRDATLSVLNEETATVEGTHICKTFQKITTLSQIETFYCTTKKIGRFVQLSIVKGYLHVCEMKVYGYYI